MVARKLTTVGEALQEFRQDVGKYKRQLEQTGKNALPTFVEGMKTEIVGMVVQKECTVPEAKRLIALLTKALKRSRTGGRGDTQDTDIIEGDPLTAEYLQSLFVEAEAIARSEIPEPPYELQAEKATPAAEEKKGIHVNMQLSGGETGTIDIDLPPQLSEQVRQLMAALMALKKE
ncbi:MAG TPA: hypothetical protein VI913_04125 [Candidatus Peribacteraceae bacterium]|nr:hypothetical protein [Candidatus Peribacteraceae bacterium]